MKNLKKLLEVDLRSIGSVEVLQNNSAERDRAFENLQQDMMETAFMAGIRNYPERRGHAYDLDQSVF